jgi:hypothetical protein
VLFNVFDVSGSGMISKKEFSSMAQAVIVGGRTVAWDRQAGRSDPGPGFEYFKPMVEMMVEMAMLEVSERHNHIFYLPQRAAQDRTPQ